MQSDIRDLTRLTLTAAGIAAVLLYADFQASRAVAGQGGAMERTDSPRYVAAISAARASTRPEFVEPRRAEPQPAPAADSTAAPSAKLRSVVAFAR